jgi:hypothetical protein
VHHTTLIDSRYRAGSRVLERHFAIAKALAANSIAPGGVPVAWPCKLLEAVHPHDDLRCNRPNYGGPQPW